MTTATSTPTEQSQSSASGRAFSRAAARVWALHLLCFVLPVTTLVFWLTAPHRWWVALAFVGVLVASVMLDGRAPAERRQPDREIPGWPFDGMLYSLVALQVINVGLAVQAVSTHGFWRVDTLVGWQLLGISAGYSGIVVAHELMHRPVRHMQWLSRLLMSMVLYEHFFTEHLRGHHQRVGLEEDGATARFGETYHAFFRRTVPAQFKSAWGLDRTRVIQGLVFEWGLAAAVWVFFGVGAFAFFVLQALVAIRLLEAVNYFEHWGLQRQARRVRTVDSWDTESWFTLYTLVGLSRHADHHAHSQRPFQELRHFDESPKLPTGYFGMVFLTFARNQRFQKLMTEELQRRKLGPFAPEVPQAS
jgi:alkane 1-monooxygenase